MRSGHLHIINWIYFRTLFLGASRTTCSRISRCTFCASLSDYLYTTLKSLKNDGCPPFCQPICHGWRKQLTGSLQPTHLWLHFRLQQTPSALPPCRQWGNQSKDNCHQRWSKRNVPAISAALMTSSRKYCEDMEDREERQEAGRKRQTTRIAPYWACVKHSKKSESVCHVKAPYTCQAVTTRYPNASDGRGRRGCYGAWKEEGVHLGAVHELLLINRMMRNFKLFFFSASVQKRFDR